MNHPNPQTLFVTRVVTLTVASILMLVSATVHSRPKLESTCDGGMPIAFVRACDSHAAQGYVPLRRQLSDGSCMNMCCQQDPNGNISCVSDPNQIPSKIGASNGVFTPPSRSPAKALAAPAPGVLPNAK